MDTFALGCAMMRAQNAAIDSDKHARALRLLIDRVENWQLYIEQDMTGDMTADRLVTWMRAAVAEARRAVDD